MLHPVPAVPRAVSLRSRLPRRWPAFVLLPLVALAWPVPVAHAVDINVLSNPSVAPGSGTTGTSFTFSVHYASTQGQVAQRVVALSSGWSVELILSAGTSTDGTYIGARTLPAGSWPVEFRAVSQGKDPLPISGPNNRMSDPRFASMTSMTSCGRPPGSAFCTMSTRGRLEKELSSGAYDISAKAGRLPSNQQLPT